MARLIVSCRIADPPLGFQRIENGLSRLADKGAEINDSGLAIAEFAICYGASVGSIKRRYWSNERKAKAWAELCREEINPVVLPGGDAP